MTVPTCEFCDKPFADAAGCEYPEGYPRPVTYGSEKHPLSRSERCRECAVPRGRLHHLACLCSECEACGGQFGLCRGIECEEVAAEWGAA